MSSNGLPYPLPNANPSPQKVQEFLDRHVMPILNRYGAHVVFCDTSAHLKAEPFERFIILAFEYQGDRVELGGAELHQSLHVPHMGNLEFLLAHWDALQGVIEEMPDHPFHYDIQQALRVRWPKANLTDTLLAYSYVCGQLNRRGKIVTGD